MTIQQCISISQEFKDLAQEHHISWSEAARIGMSILLADRGVKDYDNNLNLYRKMTQFRLMAENLGQRLDEMEKMRK